ncbi:sugar phosphate nucleotidyltransferase [Candidatus Marsarchaeota archaeon]|jgi:mannose-1-phosphate guanylyltransferase|nr:sugar phosphate nucleotidyltransferase [Candidatus Marsarchaeota archaeon]MCL5090162.1 sugar phosphate nucleotidyltransferase [Candidatus Marsarchaeota archaeon]
MKKQISITLDSELLNKVDVFIDGAEIRNRSHAIEKILRSAVSQSNPKKAVIFAGGPTITINRHKLPKPMVNILGKPILRYIIEELKRNNIFDIILATGEDNDSIIKYFWDGSQFGVRIKYIKEPMDVGTEGALANIIDLVGGIRFFALNGDHIFRMDMGNMCEQHVKSGSMATMALVTSDSPTRFGVTKLEGYKIINFAEKPPNTENEKSGLINAGIYIFEPEVKNFIKKSEKKSMLENGLFPMLAKTGKLSGYIHSGIWHSLDNNKDPNFDIKKMTELVSNNKINV